MEEIGGWKSLRCVRCVEKTIRVNVPKIIKSTEKHFSELISSLIELWFYSRDELESRLWGSLERLTERIREIDFSEIPELNFLLSELSRKALEESVRDPLTWLNNKRIYFARISKLSKGYVPETEETNFSMAQLDIDFFKRFNDRYWHAVWDKVLKAFSYLLTEFFWEKELFRYWGEEFIILIEWRKENLLNRLEKFKRRLSEFQIEVDENWTKASITFSAWILEYRWEWSNTFYQKVDVLTYSAKENWRDQIKVW